MNPIILERIQECRTRLESFDRSYYMGTIEHQKTRDSAIALSGELETLLADAKEFGSQKEVQAVATLICLCRLFTI
jgi:hypothetical protein